MVRYRQPLMEGMDAGGDGVRLLGSNLEAGVCVWCWGGGGGKKR